MNTHIGLAAVAAVCIAGPVAANEAVTTQQERGGTVSVNLVAPQAGGAGWQKYYNYAVPAGKNIIFTDQCPSSAPVAVNGAFSATNTAKTGLSLVSNFRVGNDASKWTWAIDWPKGAPAGSHIYFNVYCTQ